MVEGQVFLKGGLALFKLRYIFEEKTFFLSP